MTKQNNQWKFPLSVPKGGIKKTFKLILGNASLIIQPSLKKKFLAGYHPKSRLERITLATLVSNLGKKGELGELAKVHKNLWANADAFQFYAWSDKRFDSWFKRVKPEIEATIQRFIEVGIDSKVVEIGCGSGKILNHFYGKFSFDKLLGLDINEQLIDYNKSNYHNHPKLKFEAADASLWVDKNNAPKTIYLTFGGVLEYFTESELIGLLQSINKGKSTAILFFEPIAQDFDLNNENHSRIFGSELSFSHPYPRFVNELGMKIILNKNIVIGNFRFILLGAYIN